MTGRTGSVGPRRLVAGLAAAVLVGATAACYSYSGARYGGPDAPLQARLASAHGGQNSLHFAVSDRAHVALFRVHDSGYVRALYPYHPRSSSIFGSGGHTVLTSTPSVRYRWPSVTRFATNRRDTYSCAGGFGHVSTSYLMIVASRRPLRVERIRNEVPFRYRRVSVLATPFHRGTAFGAMDRLLTRLVPQGLARDDWDVDWVVATDFGSPWCRRLRPPLLRRIAADPGSADDDTTGADSRRRRLDTGDLPFDPPRIPIDLPEVASLDGGEGTGRVRVPLPPVEVTPVPRVGPEGQREEPAVEEFDGLERQRRLERVREGRERRRREAGPSPAPGPSEHFGRLFGTDDGREAAGWIPGWTGDQGRPAGRRVRQWTRELTKWANDPNRHEFPDPPRPPARWRGGDGWRGDRPMLDRPAPRVDAPDDLGDVRRVDPPTRPNSGRDIEVTRPPSEDRGGEIGARKSGGGSSDDPGGR